MCFGMERWGGYLGPLYPDVTHCFYSSDRSLLSQDTLEGYLLSEFQMRIKIQFSLLWDPQAHVKVSVVSPARDLNLTMEWGVGSLSQGPIQMTHSNGVHPIPWG